MNVPTSDSQITYLTLEYSGVLCHTLLCCLQPPYIDCSVLAHQQIYLGLMPNVVWLIVSAVIHWNILGKYSLPLNRLFFINKIRVKKHTLNLFKKMKLHLNFSKRTKCCSSFILITIFTSLNIFKLAFAIFNIMIKLQCYSGLLLIGLLNCFVFSIT